MNGIKKGSNNESREKARNQSGKREKYIKEDIGRKKGIHIAVMKKDMQKERHKGGNKGREEERNRGRQKEIWAGRKTSYRMEESNEYKGERNTGRK